MIRNYPFLKRKKYSLFKSYIFVVLTNLWLLPLFGQDDTLQIHLKGIGDGTSIVKFSDGEQKNDYFIDLDIKIIGTNPKYYPNNGYIIYEIGYDSGKIAVVSKIYDNILGNYNYNIQYTYQYMHLGKIVYSVKNDSIVYVELNLNLPSGEKKLPTKIVYQNDSIDMLIDYGWPLTSHHHIIPASTSTAGIFIEIIETAETDTVRYVGYAFGNKDKGNIVHNYFPVSKNGSKKFAYINNFETEYKVNFENELILYDMYFNKIGHMYYEYNYQFNYNHVRNAILILHNDANISHSIEDGGVVFPYTRGEKENIFPGWGYYDIGEYPVSMLIPPLNKFPENYSKEPILLLHGLNGVYKYANPNDIESEDISYWYTTPRILNNIGNWDVWQMYYPNTGAVLTIAECLKVDLSHLISLYGKRIKLVTHSYGGIITRHYLVNNVIDAKNKLEKVLFLAPPFHGAYVGTRAYYDDWVGDIVESVKGIDNEGLCNRDASLGSVITKNYWNKTFPNLNDNLEIFDDYFVIMGTTNNNYELTSIHEEAFKHCDGAVPMSSASLLDKNIGFATIPGNHDDLVHAQSDLNGEKNIDKPNLIPNIINDYFSSNNEDDFVNKISIVDKNKGYDYIKAIVKHDKTVAKPDDLILSNLKTETDENYQLSLLVFEINNIPLKSHPIFYAYYNSTPIPKLLLSNVRADLLEKDYFNIGSFTKNQQTGVYYFQKLETNQKNEFHERYSIKEKILTNHDDGCAIDLIQGENKIILSFDGFINRNIQTLEINYCQSHIVSFDQIDLIFPLTQSNGKTEIKNGFIISSNLKNSSSGNINIFIDDQTSKSAFLISSEQFDHNSLTTHLLQPNGEIYNKTEWLLDTATNLYSIKVDNPMPGTWQVWAEDSALGNDKLWYQAQALFQSDIILYNTNEQQIDILDDYKLAANIAMPDKSKLSEIALKATITSPGGVKREVDFSSNPIPSDSSYLYSVPLNQDTTGIYFISIKCTGVYNGFNFERVVSSHIEVIDRSPKLFIPDIYLDGFTRYKEIDLVEQVFCQGCDPYDYSFSYNILNNNDIYISIDTSSMAFITSNSKDTLPSDIEFLLMEDEQIVYRDTVSVFNYLPDLKVSNFQLSNTEFKAGDTISISFDILNNSKSYTNNTGKIGVFLSKDSLYDKTDILLSDYQLQLFSPEESITLNESLPIPGGISFKYPYLLVVADMDSLIYELDKGNNAGCRQVEFTPQDNFKLMITVDEESGQLVFSDPNQNYPSSISYNGYSVSSVPWWNNYYIWAYASGSKLPIWVNYQFNINNLENLDSAQILFHAQGTTSEGVFYSYLYQQINNIITCSGDQQLINSTDWTTFGLMLDKSYFQEGINEIKIGTSASSMTYVALNGIAVELYYSQDTSEVIIESHTQAINVDDIQIYPNPANNVLFVKGLTEKAKVTMYDLNGKLLHIKKINNNQFDISQLRPGLYLVKIETLEAIAIEKFVKK